MITRFYVDNYKSLVNFEYKPKSFELILGANGSGKSTVFEALQKLREFIVGDIKIDELFSTKDLTRWQKREQQIFELQFVNDTGTYDYSLELHYDIEHDFVRVHDETLKKDGKFIISFERTLVPDDDEGPDGPSWRFEGQIWVNERVELEQASWPITNRSILSTFDRRQAPLTFAFKKQVGSIYFAKITPTQISSYAKAEMAYPTADFSNFPHWYRRLVQEKPSAIFNLYKELREVIEGFEELTFDDYNGATRTLQVNLGVIKDESGKKQTTKFDFEELSDGQRCLIILYTLLFCALDSDSSLFIDEPENFVSSRELQPWLMLLRERIEDYGGQAILISHHPEFINVMAPQDAIQFRRVNGGPVQIRPFETAQYEGLTPAEIVARGWENE